MLPLCEQDEEREPFCLLTDEEFRALIPAQQVAYFQRALRLDNDIREQLQRLVGRRISKESLESL